MHVADCRNCGARLPENARFCPDCGVRVPTDADATAVEEVPPDETGRVPVEVVRAAPRYFGVTPPMVVFALALVSLALAIVVFVLGHVLAGILLVVAAAVFSAAFVAAGRRLPETPVVRVSARAFRTIRGQAGLAVEAVTAQSSARLELFRLRRELSELVAERAEAARSLGEAVYAGDEKAAANGQNRMGELDRALAEKEAEMTRVAAEANERIQRAQLEVQPTAVVEPPQVPEPSPVPSEPPQPVTVPEPTPVPSEPPMPSPAPEPTPEPSPPTPEPPTPEAS
jgi:cell division septation protein DedD